MIGLADREKFARRSPLTAYNPDIRERSQEKAYPTPVILNRDQLLSEIIADPMLSEDMLRIGRVDFELLSQITNIYT